MHCFSIAEARFLVLLAALFLLPVTGCTDAKAGSSMDPGSAVGSSPEGSMPMSPDGAGEGAYLGQQPAVQTGTGGKSGGPTGNLSKKEDVGNRMAERLVQATLSYRASNGLSSFERHVEADREAQAHAEGMARGLIEFGHDYFYDRSEALRDFLLRDDIVLASISENVATSRGLDRPALEAVDGWVRSPGHRKNLESNYQWVGSGAAMSNDGHWFFVMMYLKISETSLQEE